MRIIDKTEFERYKKIHTNKVWHGSVFIYPTDTIYGIGCDALNDVAIQKIRDLKQRQEQPLSIIAPSKEWILENCIIHEDAKSWIDKLPGPYTLIFELKNPDAISQKVHPNEKTVGVRIPDHWISQFVHDIGRPIITTSPNVHGEEPIKHPHDLDVELRTSIDFAIEEGYLHNPPSKVIQLSDGNPTFLRGKPSH